MNESLFSGQSVRSSRIIYTPSSFARASLYHLQEVGELQALQSHTSSRESLVSYLFFTVLSGSGELIYGGTRYSIAQGDCVFIDCRLPYSHTPSPNDLWSLKWVHFYSPMMGDIYEKYIERGGQPVFHPDDIDLYIRTVGSIHALAETEDHIRDMRINEKIASLLTLIMSKSWHPEVNERQGLKKQSLNHIKAYLDEHYKEHISLDHLANTFYINKYYLTRVFREQFGTTILSYLDHTRVTHAKQLLRFTDMTVEEVGREVGIDEAGYFNRVFKKVEGIAPGEYRKQW